MSRKREAKDAKFGFGGRKRLGKQNDASSAANMDGFRQGNFDDGMRGGRYAYRSHLRFRLGSVNASAMMSMSSQAGLSREYRHVALRNKHHPMVMYRTAALWLGIVHTSCCIHRGLIMGYAQG